jgi:hypothetical protein
MSISDRQQQAREALVDEAGVSVSMSEPALLD